MATAGTGRITGWLRVLSVVPVVMATAGTGRITGWLRGFDCRTGCHGDCWNRQNNGVVTGGLTVVPVVMATAGTGRVAFAVIVLGSHGDSVSPRAPDRGGESDGERGDLRAGLTPQAVDSYLVRPSLCLRRPRSVTPPSVYVPRVLLI